MSEVHAVLTRLFERHRIVLWYDAKSELRAEFEAVSLPGVAKIELRNNQFGVKYRVLRQEPNQRFLLYHEGPPPPDLDNWLLDVQLAHTEFRADQAALWLAELGLGLEFGELAASHAEFFRSGRRRQALKQMLAVDDTHSRMRLKMLAICANAEPRLEEILEALLGELAEDKDEKMRLALRCQLAGFLWQQMERSFAYGSETPGMRDFAIELFKSCYAMGLGEGARLDPEAQTFVRRWKDSVSHRHAFAALSEQAAGALGIEYDLERRAWRDLVAVDLFEVIDHKILSDLASEAANRTLPAAACEQIIRQRRQSPWFERYEHVYRAIGSAAGFFEALEEADLTVLSLSDAVRHYTQAWYRLDQVYRQFHFHARSSGQPTLLAPLAERVENLYTNNFLLKLNDRWQEVVDACERWQTEPYLRQDAFWDQRVHKNFLQKGNKIFVVISDGLRYETGEELLRLIRQEDRYEASLEAALTLLPSFTQLGMAALLPHQALALAADGQTVLVDDQSSQGLDYRQKALERALPGRARAIKAEDLLAMGKEEARALVRDHDVVYVYHNRIDQTGDKRESEERVFEAAQDTLEELVRIVKKLVNANASNVLITADHGFIYQHQSLAESDFLSVEPEGAAILNRNRRFVLGKGLAASPSFKKLTSAQVGLQGDMEILIPKSINRLRVRGAGSRYVHGGASLQEIIVPVLQVTKKRESDVSVVEVDILRGASAVITSGQITVPLYQTAPVSEKVQPRRLRAGIYTLAGAPISDQHDLIFDLAEEDPRQRERRVQFVLTRQADEANNQEVILRLDERIPETTHYRPYKTARYQLRRSFTSDFEW